MSGEPAAADLLALVQAECSAAGIPVSPREVELIASLWRAIADGFDRIGTTADEIGARTWSDAEVDTP